MFSRNYDWRRISVYIETTREADEAHGNALSILPVEIQCGRPTRAEEAMENSDIGDTALRRSGVLWVRESTHPTNLSIALMEMGCNRHRLHLSNYQYRSSLRR
jgi:hypothetical protein